MVGAEVGIVKQKGVKERIHDVISVLIAYNSSSSITVIQIETDSPRSMAQYDYIITKFV